MKTIEKFTGEYAFLSNFYPSIVTWSGHAYPTVEHAFQAAKTVEQVARRPFQLPAPVHQTASRAKQEGRKLRLRPEWEEYKLGLMHDLLREKFREMTMARRLLETGNARLIEGNTWGDTYWGAIHNTRGSLVGENNLGRLLMEVRDELNGLVTLVPRMEP
jgi:ribA/ribD-fused uncharacterized protein